MQGLLGTQFATPLLRRVYHGSTTAQREHIIEALVGTCAALQGSASPGPGGARPGLPVVRQPPTGMPAVPHATAVTSAQASLGPRAGPGEKARPARGRAAGVPQEDKARGGEGRGEGLAVGVISRESAEQRRSSDSGGRGARGPPESWQVAMGESAQSSLASIAALSPEAALACRSALARHQVLGALALHLTQQYLHDELAFITSCLPCAGAPSAPSAPASATDQGAPSGPSAPTWHTRGAPDSTTAVHRSDAAPNTVATTALRGTPSTAVPTPFPKAIASPVPSKLLEAGGAAGWPNHWLLVHLAASEDATPQLTSAEAAGDISAAVRQSGPQVRRVALQQVKELVGEGGEGEGKKRREGKKGGEEKKGAGEKKGRKGGGEWSLEVEGALRLFCLLWTQELSAKETDDAAAVPQCHEEVSPESRAVSERKLLPCSS